MSEEEEEYDTQEKEIIISQEFLVKTYSRLRKLETIIFDKIRIKEIMKKSFDNTCELKSLELKSLNISDLPIELFHKLEKLEFLNINCNKQEITIPPNLFDKLINLYNLNLENFKCTNLHFCIFINSNLTILNLNGNIIEILENRDMFKNLKSLKKLELSNCGIKEIGEDMFNNETLEFLDLSWNQLTKFNSRMLGEKGCKNILSIKLYLNKIKKIYEEDFVGINEKIELLDFRHNKDIKIIGLPFEDLEMCKIMF